MIRDTFVVTEPRGYLALTVANGERCRSDRHPHLSYPPCHRPENPAFLALAKEDDGAVVWPGEMGIAPETPYRLSVGYATVAA